MIAPITIMIHPNFDVTVLRTMPRPALDRVRRYPRVTSASLCRLARVIDNRCRSPHDRGIVLSSFVADLDYPNPFSLNQKGPTS